MSADPLTDFLTSVRLTGCVFFRIECGRPWAAEAPPSRELAGHVLPGVDHVMEFHAVARGSCLAGPLDEPPVRLEAGDVICFPRGDPHVLSSEPGLRAPPDLATLRAALRGPLPAHLTVGARPVETEIVCGFLGCDLRPFNPLLPALPRVLRASDRDGPRRGWLSRFLEVAEAESRNPGPAGAGVLSRLSEVMFVELVRRHVESGTGASAGWLSAMCDPHVGRALSELHARPGEDWTLPRLARAAGLARSSLAARFAALVGAPPMQYLARWRMHLAADLLATTQDGVAAIAGRVGYGSEAAFHRTFKKVMGMPPAAWRSRRARRAGPRASASPPRPAPPPLVP
jgi:AraC-like DNA-binding protein